MVPRILLWAGLTLLAAARRGSTKAFLGRLTAEA